MYRPLHLFRVARRGLADMLPALRHAFNDRRDDDRLDRVFGPRPRAAIAVGTLVGLLVGNALQSAFSDYPLFEFIHVTAVLFGVAYALLYRRYLFADPVADEHDFPWLAAALIPPAAAMVLLEFVRRTLGGVEAVAGGPLWTSIGPLLHAVADSLAVAAGLTIAVAALCYSRAWGEAIRTLIRRLIVFKIVVWVMVLLFVEIGFIGPILERLIEGLLRIDVPDWLGDFVDELTYAALMSTIYLAIIGGTWTAARRSFGALLRDGEVDIVGTLAAMAEHPEKRRKRLRKERVRAGGTGPAGDEPPPRD